MTFSVNVSGRKSDDISMRYNVESCNNNNNNNNNAIGGLGGRHKKITINGHFRKWSISSECVTILFSP